MVHRPRHRLKGDPSWLVTDFVESGRGVGSDEVKFILKNPVAYSPSLVATVPYYPVNPNIYPADKIVPTPTNSRAASWWGWGPTGRVLQARPGIVLEPNPSFWGAKPKNDMVVIRYFADATTMRLALEKGELDFAFKSFNPSDIADLEKSDKIKTIKGQGPYIRYLCFQCNTPPFDNKIVRQGVAAAINRPEIIKKVFLGQNEPLYSMVPMGMWTHTDNFKDDRATATSSLSKSCWQQAGLRQRTTSSNSICGTPPATTATPRWTWPPCQTAVRSHRCDGGRRQVGRMGHLQGELAQPAHAGLLLGWYPDYIDPDNYTNSFAGTAGSRGNGIYFSDPVWDKMFVDARKIPIWRSVREPSTKDPGNVDR
jgi:peptide/nickel transport system substrate-binding protein